MMDGKAKRIEEEAPRLTEEGAAIVGRMQELLEAERAGVAALDAMAKEAEDPGRKEFLLRLRHEEGVFCAGLFALIERRGAVPTRETGAFAGKVMALEGEAERLALLVKGQGWVVRRIDEMPAGSMTDEEKLFFGDMKERHVKNIEACRKYLPPGE
jgi:hypothetical protein